MLDKPDVDVLKKLETIVHGSSGLMSKYSTDAEGTCCEAGDEKYPIPSVPHDALSHVPVDIGKYTSGYKLELKRRSLNSQH
jgi:hypothetical protein